MLKTIIRTTACLAVSATAFVVITKMDATRRETPVAVRARSIGTETRAEQARPARPGTAGAEADRRRA